MSATSALDVAIVGAGPAGMATAIACGREGLTRVVFDKGSVVDSIRHFPTHMVFFTTPELLEIGNLPLVTAQEKPTRVEALKYYRRVAEHFEIPNDFVLALTGYHPDYRLLESMGVRIDPEAGQPAQDPETMETNVSGLYVAGGIAAGRQANKIFIENGRFHGTQIVRHIVSKGT